MTVVSPRPTPPSAQSKRDRTLLVGALSLLGVAAIITSSVLWLTRPQSVQPSTRSGIHWANPAPTDQLTRARERALFLREHFAFWARGHSALLSALKHSGPNDLAALQRAYDGLPSSPDDENIGFTSAELNDKSAPFWWNITSHPAPLSAHDQNDPLVQQRLAKGNDFQSRLRRRNFDTQHDIALGSSMTSGPVCYTIWASGRVTETQQPLGPEPILHATEKEVMPSYDFVR